MLFSLHFLLYNFLRDSLPQFINDFLILLFILLNFPFIFLNGFWNFVCLRIEFVLQLNHLVFFLRNPKSLILLQFLYSSFDALLVLLKISFPLVLIYLQLSFHLLKPRQNNLMYFLSSLFSALLILLQKRKNFLFVNLDLVLGNALLLILSVFLVFALKRNLLDLLLKAQTNFLMLFFQRVCLENQTLQLLVDFLCYRADVVHLERVDFLRDSQNSVAFVHYIIQIKPEPLN